MRLRPLPSVCVQPGSAAALVVLAVLAAAPAQATTPPAAPPIKPGLWKVTPQAGDGRTAPDTMARMKEMPPEARQRMEALLRERGVDVGSDGEVRVCLNAESLASGQWQTGREGCRSEITDRSATRWTWRARCTRPPSDTVGEVRFETPERYQVESTTTRTVDGRKKTVRTRLDAVWLGADCGNLKPLAPKPLDEDKLPDGKS